MANPAPDTITDQPPVSVAHPDQTGGSCFPTELGDRHGRLWTLDRAQGCYRHDSDYGTVFRTLGMLRAEEGPLTGPPSRDGSDAEAERYLDVKDLFAPVGNVFEWVLAHSRATGLAREVLRTLAWNAQPDTVNVWPGAEHLARVLADNSDDGVGDVEQAQMELIALGELTFYGQREDQLAYQFPAYQQWLLDNSAPPAPTQSDCVAVSRDVLAEWVRKVHALENVVPAANREATHQLATEIALVVVSR